MDKKTFMAVVVAVLMIIVGSIFAYSLAGGTQLSPKGSPSPQPTAQTTQSPIPTLSPAPTPATVQPSQATSPSITPQPSSSLRASTVSMAYYEISREDIGNNTRIKVSINVTNNSADTMILNYSSFYIDIITMKADTHPFAVAKYFGMVTGEAVPLENGITSVGGSNPSISLLLTFEFPTLQNSDGQYPFSSYQLYCGNPSLTINPFSSSNEFSSDLNALQSGNLTYPTWPFTLTRVPLTLDSVNSGMANTNQGPFSIFSSFSDFEDWIYRWYLQTNTGTVYYWVSDQNSSQFAFWVYIPVPEWTQTNEGAIYGDIFSQNIQPTGSSTPLSTPPPQATSITVSLTATTVSIGANVTITGTVVGVGGGFPVRLTALDPIGNTEILDPVMTDQNGVFTENWFPPVVGSYVVTATAGLPTRGIGLSATANLTVNQASSPTPFTAPIPVPAVSNILPPSTPQTKPALLRVGTVDGQ